MAYYTVAHLLQGGVVNGQQTGPANIKPAMLTRQVWDYILLGANYPADCGITESTLKQLRNEFEYWYPFDLRVSGKDLITNHLTFCLYNHAAMWPDQEDTKWPKGMRANGHILLNGAKMSKSTGNFMTLADAVDAFSADGMRFALADAGDSLDDANFSTKTADVGILRLYSQVEWIQETLNNLSSLRAGPPSTFLDRVFESSVNLSIKQTDEFYEKTNYREALRTGFFDLQSHRDFYRSSVGSEGMNKELILRFIEVQAILLAPITPHISEHIWKLLGKTGSVRKASWPKAGTIDEIVIQQNNFLQQLVHNLRLRKEQFLKPKAKKGAPPEVIAPPTKLTFTVAKKYPEWMEKTLIAVRPVFQAAKDQAVNDKEITDILKSSPELSPMLKKIMPFIASIKADFAKRGLEALQLKTPFDEHEFITSNSEYIKKELQLKEVEVQFSEDEKSTPGNPHSTYS